VKRGRGAPWFFYFQRGGARIFTKFWKKKISTSSLIPLVAGEKEENGGFPRVWRNGRGRGGRANTASKCMKERKKALHLYFLAERGEKDRARIAGEAGRKKKEGMAYPLRGWRKKKKERAGFFPSTKEMKGRKSGKPCIGFSSS